MDSLVSCVCVFISDVNLSCNQGMNWIKQYIITVIWRYGNELHKRLNFNISAVPVISSWPTSLEVPDSVTPTLAASAGKTIVSGKLSNTTPLVSSLYNITAVFRIAFE